MFPAAASFNGVEHRWKDEDSLCLEYMVLCQRVRQAIAAQRGPCSVTRPRVPEDVQDLAALWAPVTKCGILPMWVCAGVSATLHRVWRRSWNSAWALRAASLVSRFAGTLHPGAYETLRVAPSCLGERNRARHRRIVAMPKLGDILHWWPSVGDPGRGKLVEVVAVIRRVDPTKVSEALDMNPWFALGCGGRSTWGAVRIHHRTRLMFPPDSCCESMGSLMRHLWDTRRGLSPAQLADSVLLCQAGVACVGAPRDEMIVAEVASLLQSTSSYAMRPETVSRRWTHIPYHLTQLQERLYASGRTCAGLTAEDAHALLQPDTLCELPNATARRAFLSHRARSSKPIDLPPAMETALQDCRDAAGIVQPMPLNVRHLHAQQRGAAGSTLHEMVSDWLQTPTGRAWQAERDCLFRADEEQEAEDEPAPRTKRARDS